MHCTVVIVFVTMRGPTLMGVYRLPLCPTSYVVDFRSSAFCCCEPVDLEFAAWQPPWPRAESQHFQASTQDMLIYEILTTKRTKRIGFFFEYALYKFAL